MTRWVFDAYHHATCQYVFASSDTAGYIVVFYNMLSY